MCISHVIKKKDICHFYKFRLKEIPPTQFGGKLCPFFNFILWLKFDFTYVFKGFARGSPHSVLLAFSQSYVKHDLRKNKIVIPFFC
jgi:hypothetical protein